MKTFQILLLICIIVSDSTAQKKDRIWAFGDSTGIDFNDLSNPVAISSNSSYSEENNASICDNYGNLLFYLGGDADATGLIYYFRMKIFNKNGVLMDNGDSIMSDYTETNGLMIIPFPADSNKYYLFQLLHLFTTAPSRLYYSVIDMSFNGGLGKVISKNIPLTIAPDDSLCEKLAAVRHGNGEDWWLLCHQYIGSNYYEFLIKDSGIAGPFIKNVGSCFCSNDNSIFGEMCFSNSGDRLLNVSVLTVDIMNFDRCNGEIMLLYQFGDSVNPDYPVYYGCSFSHSGRFVYVSTPEVFPYNVNRLFQLDLEAQDIVASKYLVYEGPTGNYHCAIGQHQIGPNDKIYISFSKGIPYQFSDSTNLNLSVINDPDSLGVACNFQPFSFYLNGRMTGAGLPNLPNYNLGQMVDPSCDSISNTTQLASGKFLFSILPNPAYDKVTIKYEIFGRRGINLEIRDLSGAKVIILKLSDSSTSTELLLSNLLSGVYIVTLSHGSEIFTRSKLAIIK